VTEPHPYDASTDLKCAECGAQLTVAEVEASEEAGLPMLCTTHLTERTPIEPAAAEPES
jgi:hypothetical protein